MSAKDVNHPVLSLIQPLEARIVVILLVRPMERLAEVLGAVAELLTSDVDVQPRDGETAVILHNDSAGLWAGELVITRRGTDAGTPMLAEQRLPFHLSARSALTVALDRDVLEPDDGRRELLVAEADGAETAYGYFVEDTELHLEPVAKAMAVAVEPTADGYDVTVEAGALVKDLAVFPDRLDPEARVDSALVTLPSGRSHTFRVTGRDLDEVALTTRPVLRSVNDLIAR